MGSVFKCADFLSRRSRNASLLGAKDARKKEKKRCLWSLQKNSVVQTEPFVSRKQLGIFTRDGKQLKLLVLPCDR